MGTETDFIEFDPDRDLVMSPAGAYADQLLLLPLTEVERKSIDLQRTYWRLLHDA